MSNPAIETIREITKGTPYEGHLFLVGGYVRDKIMGRPSTEDVDLVLEGNALELAQFIHDKGLADHRPVTYPRFGTAMVTIKGHSVELVSARKEKYTPNSRKPNVEHAALHEDILRRDFTINTLLENLHTGEIYDFTGMAMADIEAKIIRTPTDPDATFYDDPLRMLRAIRFAARLGFKIEPLTWDAILRNAQRLKIVSNERIRDEFAKILLSDNASRGLCMLSESSLLDQFAPELQEMRGVSQDGGHAYDVWEHTLHALESLPPDADLIVRLAVIFHDVGKPKTKTRTNGRIRFYGHEDVSAEITRIVLNRLRFPKDDIARVARLVSMHMRVGEYRSEWKDSAVKRLMRDAGDDMPDLLALALADRRGYAPGSSTSEIEELRRRIERILINVPVHKIESPLNGREIMEVLGLPPGPKVKEAKQFLLDEVLEGRLQPGDKDSAKRLLRERFQC